MRRLVHLAALAVVLAGGAVEEPRLVVGVLSDVHMNPGDARHLYERRFQKALRFFDAQKVDAVVGCGDWIELGWHEWFRLVGRYWNEAFPNGRRSDGQPIEKLFIFGDHEIENFWNPNITRAYSREYILAHDIPTYGRARIYEETLGEPWAPIMRKRIKGYDFVGAHFTMREDADGRVCDKGTVARWGEFIPGFDEFFVTNRFDSGKPFFCLMHKPPKGTVVSPLVSTSYDERPTRTLARHPNCVCLCGHKHKSATSEHSLWQGAFTCVEVPSLQTVQTDAGHENGWASCDGYAPTDPPQQMKRITTSEDGGQCLVMKVYDDRIVLERWNVVFEEKCAEDWLVPLPHRPDRPAASFEARAAKAKPVAFPASAQVRVERRRGPDRAGITNSQYVVTFPRAVSDSHHGRGYDYRVTAETTKHFWKRITCEKWVYSDKCYLPESRDTNDVVCVFSAAEAPGPFEQLQFTVTPYNAFGQAGAAIVSAPLKYVRFGSGGILGK